MRSKPVQWLVAGALLFACAVPGWAQPDLIGDEFRVNQYGKGRPLKPMAAFGPSGNSLIVWEHDNLGIAGRFFDRNGVPTSAELLLVANANLPTIPARGEVTLRKDPALLYLPNGEFLLVWTEEKQDLLVRAFYAKWEVLNQDIMGQRFDGAGNPLGERFRVNAAAAGFQRRPSLALKTGGIVVVWEDDVNLNNDKFSRSVRGRLLSRRGQPTGAEFRVDDGQSPWLRNAALAVNGAGDFLVAWEMQDADGPGIAARAYQMNGAAKGLQFGVTTTQAGLQGVPAALAMRDGGFLVAWQSFQEGTTHHGIYGQFFSSAGSRIGSEFLVSSGLGEAQYSTALALLPNGDVLVSWMDYQGIVQVGVYMTVIDKAGQRQGDDLLASRELVYIQKQNSVSVTANGDILATWEGRLNRTRGITARRLRID
ncbi:MAG TPA: hypothetical protein VE078_05550 [Thermoanaerobaculia bacterium]|nr:hypothetical protein [Thermoanaerobaculia bacterium]